MINFYNQVEKRPAVTRRGYFPGRTYISNIGSVKDWKMDELYLYSDLHKDVYGHRGSGAWMLEDDIPMEKVMKHMDALHVLLSEEIFREAKERAKWETEKWQHRLLLDEARREGIVFPNPDVDAGWDDEDYLDWKQEHKELYYFTPKLAGHKMSELGTLI